MTADVIRREGLHSCGNEYEKALDPETSWFVDHTRQCHACATKDMVARQEMRKHEKDPEIPGIPAWDDGRIVTVRPVTAADIEAARRGTLQTITKH